MKNRKRLLSEERKQKIKTNLVKWLKSVGYAILPIVFKKVKDKTGVDIPDVPKQNP
jgi:hypothetical protein